MDGLEKTRPSQSRGERARRPPPTGLLAPPRPFWPRSLPGIASTRARRRLCYRQSGRGEHAAPTSHNAARAVASTAGLSRPGPPTTLAGLARRPERELTS